MRVNVSWLRNSALPSGGGDEAEQHEHDREAEHEQAGVDRDALQVVALLPSRISPTESPGDEAEVAGHDRQHARRQERDDPAAERGEQVEVAGDAHAEQVQRGHRRMVRPDRRAAVSRLGAGFGEGRRQSAVGSRGRSHAEQRASARTSA